MKKTIVVFGILIYLLFNLSLINAKSYKGAEYRTKDSFLYGRYEVRYKPANREGVVSSFFTYHEIENNTGWNEIDIEFIGRYKNLVQFNTITPGQKFHIRSQKIMFNPFADFHDYAFEWTPDYVAWFVDGEEVFRQDAEHISTLQHPQKIMMNIWNPIYTGWVGYFNDNFMPMASIYDYVSYYSYTPGSGNGGSENNFTFEWKDDFNEFDSVRWEKATHTFAGNQADFDPENVVFEDGYLYLYLTDEINKSGVDIVAPHAVWAMANHDSTVLIKFSEEITQESGENANNYIIPGGNVISANLSEDNLYVKLVTNDFNPYSITNMIYSNIIDLSDNSNSSITKVIVIDKVDSITFPIKINNGGESVIGFESGKTEWSSKVPHGYLNGRSHSYSLDLDILNTDQDEIFRSDHRGIISYKVKVPPGNYSLSLLFSDNTNNEVGDAIFNVFAEGEYIQKGIDLISMVGKYSYHRIDSEVSVEDGILDIYFEEEIDSAFISAIIIDKILTNINDDATSQKDQFELNQNYPNPFNASTNISFSVKEKLKVKIVVYDIVGNEISTLTNREYIPGKYNLDFNASDLSSGVYLCELSIDGNYSRANKMVLLK